MSKTYLCGKIGKSVKFNPNTWAGAGGDNEAPTLLRKIAELNPDDTFIIISRNDVSRHREALGLPSNLIDIYEDATKEQRKNINYIIDRLKDVKIDGCFLMCGPTANVNIPNKSWKRKDLVNGKKVHAKSLFVFENYVAPMYNYLNETMIPWVMIANDPRYIKQGNDLLNQPVKVLSQFTEEKKMKHYDNWDDQVYVYDTIQCIYAGMEKIFLIDTDISNVHNTENKTCKIMIPLNEGNNGVKSRYSELKKYVLDFIDDVEIYGKWSDEIMKDSRFKGTMKFHDLQNALNTVKYSFMISIDEGWTTMKIWELISHGVIPFMHPGYDSQRNTNVPEYLRIKEPKDLHNKINELEENPDLHKQILRDCLNCIDEGDISGKTLSDKILAECPKINKNGYDFLTIKTINEEIIKEKITQDTDIEDW